VYGVGTGYPKPYDNSGTTRCISLVHVSASGGKSGSGVKNHYHYGVTSAVYEAHFKRLESVN